MNEHRKDAYRYLLYWALLDIRGIEWITYRAWRFLNPLILRRELRRASRAGAIADWLHNLAHYSSLDFDGFDENLFWKGYERFVNKHGDPWKFREVFERRLRELDDAS